MPMGKRLRLTGLLVALAIPGIIMVALSTPHLLRNFPGELPPVPVLMIAAGLQSLVITALLALLGAWVAPRLGLAAPALEGWLNGQDPRPMLAGQARVGLAAGIVAGLSMVAADVLLFRPYLPAALDLLGQPVTLRDLATALTYGGILEEIWMRWALMSLFAWLFSFVLGRQKIAAALLLGNMAAAVLFGVGHFGAVQALVGELTTPVIVRTLVLNGLPGVLFGLLFQRKGLECAMFAHMGAHLGMNLVRLLV